MLVKKGYKYRLYPTVEQRKYLESTFGCCRKACNILLAEHSAQYEAYKVSPDTTDKPKASGYDFSNQLTILKDREDLAYLNDVSSTAVQNAVLNLGRAFTNFFKNKKGYPKFQSRFSKNSFTLTGNTFKIDGKHLTLPKLKTPIRVTLSRQLPSEPSNVTISRTPDGKYCATFLCDTPPKVTNGHKVVGLDLGVKELVVTSDDQRYHNPKTLYKLQHKLARLQRKLSRKTKGSASRNLARIHLARLHAKITNIRKDYILKLCRYTVNASRVIVVESLMVKNMVKNHHLAKALSDASFGMILSALRWMVVESNWCNLVQASTYFPSTQICSDCNLKSPTKLTLNVREWVCTGCGSVHDRDYNAAKNLRNLALHPTIEPQWRNATGKLIKLDNSYM